MSDRWRPLLLIAILASLHGTFYIWYQQPDWTVAWTDQGGYRMLAHGLAAGGGFTRYPGIVPFVPEAIRTPGYPLFLALMFRLFGASHVVVACAQTGLFVLISMMAYALGRRVGGHDAAVGAGMLTALYAPLPYFAALVLTEVWTTFVLVAAVLAAWRAIDGDRPGWYAAAGFLFAYTALSRPVFILLAPFLGGVALVLLWTRTRWREAGGAGQARPQRRHVLQWALMMGVFMATVLPWLAYNHRHFGVATISPAGGIGRGIWEASWQGRWSSRAQSSLTDLADSESTDPQLADHVRAFARDAGEDPAPMLTYVQQWRSIRLIWTVPEKPDERVRARIVADRMYLSVGLQNIRQDVAGYLKRRLVRGQFVLWAAEIPVRYTTIDRLPTWMIRAIWLPQVIIAALGMVGLIALARRGASVAALLLGAPLVYVGAVHFLLLTEARQSLPVKPLLIVLAVVGATVLRTRAVRPS